MIVAEFTSKNEKIECLYIRGPESRAEFDLTGSQLNITIIHFSINYYNNFPSTTEDFFHLELQRQFNLNKREFRILE